MKVTIYTINDAESDFCKQAKDFLTAHNIQFENKDVEHDRKALSEMLALSDNFSGVPVIVVETDGGEKKVLKGFTQTEVEQALGLASDAAASMPAMTPPAAPIETPSAPAAVEPLTAPVEPTPIEPAPLETPAPVEPMVPEAPVMPVEPVVETPAPVETPLAPAPVEPMPVVETPAPIEPAPVMPTEAPVETPAVPMPVETPTMTPDNQDDKLKGIMDTLAQNGAQTPTEAPAPMPSAPTPTPLAPAGDMPSIPDFPQK